MIGLKILEFFKVYEPLDYHHKRFERLGKKCNQIEAIFWSAAYFELSKCGRLTPQVDVGRYRLDFALQGENFKVAIEIDGHDTHKSRDQRQHDYERERRLQELGWFFIRFTGSDVYGDAQGCVAQCVRIVRRLS